MASNEQTAHPGRATLPYLAGLDGLRAIAIAAVLLYHAGLPWMQGGFLGVEVFFVLSGYVLASLLLAEWRATGRVDSRSFWWRRARRLLPALYLLLAVTLCGAALALPGELARVRSDTLAALGFVTNWYLILINQSYFEAVARPSLLQHLWSLALEEQFYLLLPLLLGLLLRRRRLAVVALLLAAAASAAWMAWLYRPALDPSRVYYGLDTRAAGLLLGTAIALIWVPHEIHRRDAEDAEKPKRISASFASLRCNLFAHGRRVTAGLALAVDAAGIAALAILLWCFTSLHAYEPALYRGGFALVALATATLIAVVVHPRALLGGFVLGRPALRWLGQRSYSIYLWHWPVFGVTRPQLDLPISGLLLALLRLAATLLLAELSFRLVEWPMRRGGVRRTYAGYLRRGRTAFGALLHGASPAERRLAGGVVLLNAACMVVLGLAIVRAVASAQTPTPPAYLAVRSITPSRQGASMPKGAAGAQPQHAMRSAAATPSPAVQALGIGASLPAASPSPASPAAASVGLEPPTPLPPTSMPPTSAPSTPEPSTPLPPTPEPATAPPPTPAAELQQAVDVPAAPDFGRVGAVGDSVLLSAAAALQGLVPGMQIDAEVSRQVDGALWVLQSWQAGGQLGDTVIVHIGNNGVFTPEQFDATIQALAGVPRVFVLTVKVPRPWEAPNNAVIVEGVARHRHIRLIDWRAASVDHPEYFWDDGIHLRPEGAAVYADLVRAELAKN